MSEPYLIRLGPPAKGDTIHTSECRHATATNALRWAWADMKGFENIDWYALRRKGIRPCRLCLPELLREADGSSCCGAGVRVDSGDEGTSCYVCERCGKPCDARRDAITERSSA